MTALVDNPVAADPMKALTPGQRDALLSIAAFRHHRFKAGSWQFGPKRFNKITVDKLERLNLVAPPLAPAQPFRITVAGKLAVDKLKGNNA